MTYWFSIKNEEENYKNRNEGVTKRFIMLRFMIDGVGVNKSGDIFFRHYDGGKGFLKLNCEGGFGWDKHVRGMIKDGEITISRDYSAGWNKARTIATVTAKGRKAYLRLCKR